MRTWQAILIGDVVTTSGSIPTADRWAIIAYIRALQRSQLARLDDVPPEERAKLEGAAP